jgi:hypothetical protein
MHPSELQILPYLTNQAFDAGCDLRLLQSGCQMQMCMGDMRRSLYFQSCLKATFGLGGAQRSQKAKLIGSA